METLECQTQWQQIDYCVCAPLKIVVKDMGHGHQFLSFEGGDAYSRKLPIWVWKWSTGPKSPDGLTLCLKDESFFIKAISA